MRPAPIAYQVPNVRPLSPKSPAGRSRFVLLQEQLRVGLAQAGLPAGAIGIVVSIQASFAAGAFDIVTGDVERLGRRPPKPLRDVLAEALRSSSA
jgi:NAD(P)H dehydrogenase (quinone)